MTHANATDRAANLEKFRLARTLIAACWPYLAPVAFRLPDRWTDAVPTLAVDKHWRLYLNPAFVARTDPHTLALLIAGHEVQHLVLGHNDRLTEHRHTAVTINGQSHSLTNVAHDLAINAGLKSFAAAGTAYRATQNSRHTYQFTAPANALYAEKFRTADGRPFPAGQISEVYAKLLLEAPPDPDGGGGSGDGSESGSADQDGSGSAAGCGKCGSGAGDPDAPWEDPGGPEPGDPTGGTGVGQVEQELIRGQVAKAVTEQAARARGTVPAGLELWAKVRLTPPKHDWRRELRAVVRNEYGRMKGVVDYTYQKPNRRQSAAAGGVILPGTDAPVPRLAVVIDASGSMRPADYDAAFSEVAGVLKAAGLPKVPVLVCDAAVSAVQWVSDVRQLSLKGGGGTDMGAGIAAAVARPVRARFVLLLTDGETPYGEQPPGVRVVVVLTGPRPSGYPIPDWARVLVAADPK